MTDDVDTEEVEVVPYVIISDKDGNEKRLDELTSHPDNRHFREAWSLSGTVITEDLDISKEIFKDKIREVRTPLLETEDVTYMRAIEDDDSAAKTASATKKQSLRDAPADPAIASATTIEDLKAAWDTELLGTSPYSQ